VWLVLVEGEFLDPPLGAPWNDQKAVAKRILCRLTTSETVGYERTLERRP